MSEPLDVEIRAALEARRGSWPAIAKDCDVSYSWLSQFVRGKITNPGYATLMRLRTALIDAEGVPSMSRGRALKATRGVT